MGLHFKSLRSSSKGNCVHIWTRNSQIIIDCGFEYPFSGLACEAWSAVCRPERSTPHKPGRYAGGENGLAQE
jgi:hypothetical protein